MTEDRLISLIVRQQSGNLAPDEIRELEQWGDEAIENGEFLRKVSEESLWDKEISIWNNIDTAKGFVIWKACIQARRRARIFRIIRSSAVASMLFAALAIALVNRKQHIGIQTPVAVVVNYPVLPGRNTAILTLANGHQILLDSVAKGQLALQGASRIVKEDNSSVSYVKGVDEDKNVTYNVLATPKSGQYQLTLPDGSKVWLNNVSSLHYPTSFRGKTRTVDLTGEGYFEIAHDASRPFIVKVRDASIEVLGTRFNVMAYAEEEGSQTTLLNGAVELQTKKATKRLLPDQQAQVGAGGDLKIIKNVASQDIVSWKDGFFYFGKVASFEAMMRQLARWYDVEVIYEGKAPEMEFGGKIDRNLPLNDVLKFLDKNQIHLRLEGRKLVVLPG